MYKRNVRLASTLLACVSDERYSNRVKCRKTSDEWNVSVCDQVRIYQFHEIAIRNSKSAPEESTEHTSMTHFGSTSSVSDHFPFARVAPSANPNPIDDPTHTSHTLTTSSANSSTRTFLSPARGNFVLAVRMVRCVSMTERASVIHGGRRGVEDVDADTGVLVAVGGFDFEHLAVVGVGGWDVLVDDDRGEFPAGP